MDANNNWAFKQVVQGGVGGGVFRDHATQGSRVDRYEQYTDNFIEFVPRGRFIISMVLWLVLLDPVLVWPPWSQGDNHGDLIFCIL